jgi:hypothetical protein
MAKKMYYTEEEAAQALSISAEALGNLVRDDKLRVFKDGARNMFRADDIEKLVAEGVPAEEDIELTPADTSSGSSISLADSVQMAAPGKEDTVITAEGISIFDEEDLDIEAADPLAKTQISMPMEEQAASDGSGSGSGLLDLTRESDDTSLGEVLDRIDMSGSGAAGPINEDVIAQAGGPAMAEPAGPAIVVAPDPMAGLFSGLVIGAAIVMLVLGAVMLAALVGSVPLYLKYLEGYKAVVLVGGAVIIGAAGVANWVLGKGAEARKPSA